MVPATIASSCIPALFEPEVIGGVQYIDGGVASRLPIEAIKRFSPDVIVMLGQSAASDKVRLERIAINMMDAKNPDNDGVLPDEEPISPNGRTALFTQLPIKKLCASIAAQGVPVVVSNSCGLYVCNRLYYEALNLCEHAPQMKAIFVHVPLYKGQVDTQDGMGMNLHDMSTAIEVVIKSVLQ